MAKDHTEQLKPSEEKDDAAPVGETRYVLKPTSKPIKRVVPGQSERLIIRPNEPFVPTPTDLKFWGDLMTPVVAINPTQSEDLATIREENAALQQELARKEREVSVLSEKAQKTQSAYDSVAAKMAQLQEEQEKAAAHNKGEKS